MPPPQGTSHPLEGPADYTMTTQVHSDTYPEIDPTQWNLQGKSVFIAGASKGAGQEVAVAFARAGASHIAIGARSSLDATATALRSAAESAKRPPPSVVTVKLDITSADSTTAAATQVSSAFGGKLDLLIICAGAFSAYGNITESDPEQWTNDIHTNLVGPYLICRAFLPLVRKSTLRTVIAMASVGGHLSVPGIAAYKIGKLGVIRLMEFVVSENAEQGEDVVALSVHPGNMLTEIVGFGKGMPEELAVAFTDTPRLAADGVVFLAKEKRDWLKGRYVNLTWDLPELVGEKKREEIVKKDLLKVKLAV